MKTHKQNVFDDFIAAAEYLSDVALDEPRAARAVRQVERRTADRRGRRGAS